MLLLFIDDVHIILFESMKEKEIKLKWHCPFCRKKLDHYSFKICNECKKRIKI